MPIIIIRILGQLIGESAAVGDLTGVKNAKSGIVSLITSVRYVGRTRMVHMLVTRKIQVNLEVTDMEVERNLVNKVRCIHLKELINNSICILQMNW